MSRFAWPLSLTVLGAALALPYAAIADEPLAPYEGRPLPTLVRDLLWDKACDIPQAEAEGDTCQGDVCKFTRSNGTPFKPQLAAWMELTMFQWAVAQSAVEPALVEGKLATADEISGDLRLAVAIASGLTVDAKPDDLLVQLNPLLVRWVMREVLPPADRPMCGQTARDFYLAAFSRPTRLMVDVYAQLKARGATRGVKLAELSKNFDTQKGRYATMCVAIGKQAKDPDETWPRRSACWWWLRRAASGGTDELALLLGQTLERYDAEAFKTYKRKLPPIR